MSQGRKTSIIEVLIAAALVAILAGVFFFPDNLTQTRWELERRARNWKRTPAPIPSDSSLLATDVSLDGTWSDQRPRSHSTFRFARRSDGRYDVAFSTGGCMGGCELQRIATKTEGAIVLDGAVAEYAGYVYDTLYVIRIDEVEYLLPAAWIDEFEKKRMSGSDYWKWSLRSRVEESSEPSGESKAAT